MPSRASQLELSIVICTRGRSALLRDAIESVVGQSFPSERYELLIVDDNSTDDTQLVVAELARKYPQVVYLKNEGMGLLHARCTGQNAARGRYTAYLDDDAKACPDWLTRASKIVESKAPICFGGPFFPFYVSKKPRWYRDEYGSSTHGPAARELRDDEYLNGGNIFFESEGLRVSGGFDPEFCRPEDRWTYGDEAVPQMRMRKQFPQREFFYDPDLSILHLVRPERLKFVRAGREKFAMGRGYAKAIGDTGSDRRLLPYAWRCGWSLCRFAFRCLQGAVYRDRYQYECIQTYVYEHAFPELRNAGVFWQRLSRNYQLRSTQAPESADRK